jgi:hypothetical protein
MLHNFKGNRRLRVSVQPSVLAPNPHEALPQCDILLARTVPLSVRRVDLSVEEFQSRYLTWTVQPTVVPAATSSQAVAP